jgi:hypothetical protein
MIHCIDAVRIDRIEVSDPNGYESADIPGVYQTIKLYSGNECTRIAIHADDIYVLMPRYDSKDTEEAA